MSAASRLPLAWLVPREGESGSELGRRVQLRLSVSLVAANLIGGVIIWALSSWAFAFPPVDDPNTARLVNAIAGTVYLLIVSPFGIWWATRRVRGAREWLNADREPTPEERRAVLLAPRQIVGVHMVIWGAAAIFFGILNAIAFSGELGQRALITIALGGLTTCAVVYLISERQLRPAAARALAAGVGDQRLGPGVKMRTLLAWALGTAVPIVGLMSVGLSKLIEDDFTGREIAIAVLALGGVALIVGLCVSMLSVRAIADPVVSLRKAVERVESGDLDVEVPVYDGSEIGQLQAGFNDMVAGLRERERVQDLFGRHVGEQVARQALEGEVELGGEIREVAVLFTDVIGSTELASERPPQEVVELLNRFFGIVVDVVDAHGGWVNKFEGDAALAVFGAPVEIDDPASAALAAARELAARLERELDGLEAGIGASAGEVVAGNIGEERRFEYTVIGDPVNEAARLTELAKERPGRVLASEAILERAAPGERDRWRLDGAAQLRGRSEETRLAMPVS